MIYGVCKKCDHTKELPAIVGDTHGDVVAKCDHCGKRTTFRVVVQVEQPDGSVVEVTA